MKYALLIYGDESTWADMDEAAMREVYAAHEAYGKAMTEAGVLRGGEELAPSHSATSLRFANGKPTLHDGPFAEAREQLGGFYLIEVDTLDEALDWARKMPAMSSGTVEVRPLGMASAG
ncbi:YciI family protein [Pseudomarimonas salicorniae]|uniref:YciI family protein n=1 Tax=Pseudomarimonas salicorniae TaxID=2933270 RepID=A0ABT0GC78_9GAMM|nr:YciI family protein [Lysobacter sp. CAU 1642]MCK7592048.1 YciI family protein [Lysobacter sp. CAU 1642]